ncbi:hypothetical protein J31TS4_31720 [Paenibacillus sp. J31TS4]|nr:hypothetical protein J31TS4_31720 [Paenibacillus sp. J31TS4]
MLKDSMIIGLAEFMIVIGIIIHKSDRVVAAEYIPTELWLIIFPIIILSICVYSDISKPEIIK